jgi:multiple antibiotic resistance protein
MKRRLKPTMNRPSTISRWRSITVLIITSAEAHSFAATALMVALILIVGGLDLLIFRNIDKLAKRLNPTTLIVSELVFGILLTAVAVQLFVYGLGALGIIEPAAAH